MSLTYDQGDIPIAYDKSTQEIVSYNYQNDGTREAVGNFEILPNFGKNAKTAFENIFMVGASGSGKSERAKQYALAYRRMYPKNNIFIFSQKKTDIAFEKLEPGSLTDITNILRLRRVIVDDLFMDQEIDITTDYKDSLLIFDDFMYYEKKEYIEKIIKIIIQCLNLGRSNRIFTLITAHMFYQSQHRDLYANIQNEIHKMVWFAGVNQYQLNYSLQHYWGFNKKQIQSILHVQPSKQFMFYCLNKMPSVILTNNRCLIL